MNTPRRLLEESGVAAELRAELQSAADSGDPYDTGAGFARLQRALVGAAAAPAGGSPSADLSPAAELAGQGGSASSIAAMSFAAKAVIVAAIGSAVALGYAVLSSQRGREPPVAAVRVPAVQTVPSTPRAAAPAPAPGPQPLVAASPAAEVVQSPESAVASASRREIAQLNKIRAMLDRDPARAHRLIAASSREFPAGLFAEERAGLDAIALFRSGERRRAATAAERFIANHPKSPLRPRLERILAGDAP
jgi:hypothetical protein